MTFYVDLIYFICFGMNFIILKFHSRFICVKVRNYKIFLGSALSGLLSLEALIYDVNFLLIFIQTLLILRVVYGKCSIPEFIRRFFVLLGVVLVFGAVMNMFSKLYSGMFLKNGKIYALLSPLCFISAGVIGSFILSILLFFIKNKRTVYKIELLIDDEVIKTTALLDTGNRLLEPLSRRPVIVIDSELIKGEHEKSTIFLKTAGRDKESMEIVYVTSLTILDENRKIYDLYAGISNHTLSEKGEFFALLHSEFAK